MKKLKSISIKNVLIIILVGLIGIVIGSITTYYIILNNIRLVM